jgi:hypothetical protein
MTGNPFATGRFYSLSWSDLRGRMPFVTNMQLYDAAERLTNILNQTFTDEARKMAFEYESHAAQVQRQEPPETDD